MMITYLGASDCKLNEGSMRADVNLSVREVGAKEFGTRTEMKNLNSFKAIAHAIEGEKAKITFAGIFQYSVYQWFMLLLFVVSGICSWSIPTTCWPMRSWRNICASRKKRNNNADFVHGNAGFCGSEFEGPGGSGA